MLARNIAENAKAEALADAGIHRAVLGLLDPDPATAWRADGRVYRMALDGGEIKIQIQDEAGKVDLGHAPEGTLISLLEAVGVASETARNVAESILDYADQDSDRRPTGAEDSDYAAAGQTQGAKNAPFEHKEELLHVMGMTRQIYQAVAPYITVYSDRGDVDLLTAPETVLEAIPNLTTRQREEIKAARARPPKAAPHIDAATIRVEAMTNAGGRFIREAVVRRASRPDNPFTVLEWRHAWPAE
jgi:general secretion pathway protein K